MIKIDYKYRNDFIDAYYGEVTKYSNLNEKEFLNKKQNRFKFFHSIFDGIDFKSILISPFSKLLGIRERIQRNINKIPLSPEFLEKISIDETIKNNEASLNFIGKHKCTINNLSNLVFFKTDNEIINKVDSIIRNKFLEPVMAFFPYNESTQGKYLAPFFERIRPKTCYYCNIDFINVFQENSYNNIWEFLNYATKDELSVLNYQNYTTAEKVIELRPLSDKKSIEQLALSENALKKIKEYEKNKSYEIINSRNGFTLDHVIDKGTHPYFALSLFNLVPSCYICNSKLKGSKTIGDVSPSSDTFDFHEKVKFKTYFSTNNDKLLIEKQDDVEVYLKEYASEPTYKDYIEVFRLNERYRFHRYRVIEMIDKRKRYPDSRIQELAQLTGQTPMQVKKDLFGEYLYDDDLSKRPLSKLTRDIAEELGLI